MAKSFTWAIISSCLDFCTEVYFHRLICGLKSNVSKKSRLCKIIHLKQYFSLLGKIFHRFCLICLAVKFPRCKIDKGVKALFNFCFQNNILEDRKKDKYFLWKWSIVRWQRWLCKQLPTASEPWERPGGGPRCHWIFFNPTILYFLSSAIQISLKVI